jgi:hypothetical protein
MSNILTHRTFGLEALTVDIHRLTAQLKGRISRDKEAHPDHGEAR